MPGCIKEDLDDCFRSLYFSYLGDGTQEIFQQKIGKVTLYVYDENENLVRTIELNKEELKNQKCDLDLPIGKYHIVCWGNPYAETQINRSSNLETAILGTPQYFSRETITTNDSLYFGTKDVAIEDYDFEVDTVRFSSAHIKMRVDLTGLENEKMPDGSSPVYLEMGNLSPTADFKMNFSTGNETYYPVSSFNSATLDFTSRFNVLRFNDDNTVYFNLVNKETNQIIYSLNLKDFMSENQISVNGINEVLIGIRFRFNGATVTVNPWDEVEIRPGM